MLVLPRPGGHGTHAIGTASKHTKRASMTSAFITNRNIKIAQYNPVACESDFSDTPTRIPWDRMVYFSALTKMVSTLRRAHIP